MLANTLARRIRDPFELLGRRLEDFFEEPLPALLSDEALAPYPVDVRQDADHFYVDAELPGFTHKDIDVSIDRGLLTIKAEREEKEETKGETIRRERRWSKFFRAMQLPGEVDEGKVNAVLEDGVLKITLDRRQGAKPRKIEITSGNGGAAPPAKK